jgi:formate-dependent phosphoribosylglycinamide formyltransferase (GAR transformylase)
VVAPAVGVVRPGACGDELPGAGDAGLVGELAVDGTDEVEPDVLGLWPDVSGLAVTGVLELEDEDLLLEPHPAAANANTATTQATAVRRLRREPLRVTTDRTAAITAKDRAATPRLPGPQGLSAIVQASVGCTLIG